MHAFLAAQDRPRKTGHLLPAMSALAVWAVALGSAAALGWLASPDGRAASAAPTAAASENAWQVTDGTLDLAITQLGSRVSGRFEDWSARISYSEPPDAQGRHGSVEVVVAIPSLTLGLVTAQAMGPDHFDAATYPTATFTADIFTAGQVHVARGTLTMKGRSVPVEMPFTLRLSADKAGAEAEGGVVLDRRDFAIGTTIRDEATLGFAVEVSFRLTARRRPAPGR